MKFLMVLLAVFLSAAGSAQLSDRYAGRIVCLRTKNGSWKPWMFLTVVGDRDNVVLCERNGERRNISGNDLILLKLYKSASAFDASQMAYLEMAAGRYSSSDVYMRYAGTLGKLGRIRAMEIVLKLIPRMLQEEKSDAAHHLEETRDADRASKTSGECQKCCSAKSDSGNAADPFARRRSRSIQKNSIPADSERKVEQKSTSPHFEEELMEDTIFRLVREGDFTAAVVLMDYVKNMYVESPAPESLKNRRRALFGEAQRNISAYVSRGFAKACLADEDFRSLARFDKTLVPSSDSLEFDDYGAFRLFVLKALKEDPKRHEFSSTAEFRSWSRPALNTILLSGGVSDGGPLRKEFRRALSEQEDSFK